MQKIMMGLLLNSLGLQAAFASETTYQTVLTCAQEEGDQWYTVGLVPSADSAGKKLNLVVVYSDADANRQALIKDESVVSKKTSNRITYENPFKTLRLEVVKQGDNRLTGYFSLISEGRHNLIHLKLECEKNSQISFDSKVGPEPRISVGN